MKRISLLVMLLTLCGIGSAAVKAVWAPVWDITTPRAIDKLVTDCKEAGFNEILAQVRYRGDALYVPNKHDHRFPNPDPRSHLLQDAAFDPLDYLLQKTRNTNIKVQAWVTVFVISTRETDKLARSHMFFKHPEWISSDFAGQPMHHTSYEGAFFDPGIPAVRDYVRNVILDIAANYPVAGIHLDYIRYPDMQFGFNALARQAFQSQVAEQDAESWLAWKEGVILEFINHLRRDLASCRKGLRLTAAVVDDPDKARQKYSQNWPTWLERGAVDAVYLMAYTPQTARLDSLLQAQASSQKKKIIVGLRGWDGDIGYTAGQIAEKLALVKQRRNGGFALFSYGGLVRDGYLPTLKKNIKRY